MKDINALLLQVSKIIDTDKKIQEERRLRGEKFNVFSVLGLYQHETKLHSKIINELLNVKGDHGLKDAFLKSFIEITGLEDLDFNTAESVSQIELSIGKISDSGEDGGRIDIFVKSGKKAIVIENKIYATDQAKQLLRYSNYGIDKNFEFRLLYLNLDGSPPDAKSLGNRLTDEDYTHITYQFHIRKWLERCIELSARQPLVRETLIQYLGIVNHITNQTMDTTKQQEVIILISDNLVSAEQIANNFNKAKSLLQDEIKSKVCEILKERLSDRFEISNNNDAKYSQIWIRFHTEQVPKHIFFGVESFVGYRDLRVGIFDNKRQEKLIDSLVFPNNERDNDYWVNYMQITNADGRYINLGKTSLLEKLFKNSDLKTKFIEHIAKTVMEYVNVKASQLVEYFNH